MAAVEWFTEVMCHRFQLGLWHFAVLISLALVPLFYYSSVVPVRGGTLVSECLTDPESKVDLTFSEFLKEMIKKHHEGHHEKHRRKRKALEK